MENPTAAKWTKVGYYALGLKSRHRQSEVLISTRLRIDEGFYRGGHLLTS